jgi:hypothetical protein
MKSKSKPKKSISPLPLGALIRSHPVFYRVTQVGLCLPCYGVKPTVGLRLAMLWPQDEFLGAEGVPPAHFYPGTVTKVYGDNLNDPMVTVEFDENKGPRNLTFGWVSYARFCIPASAKQETELCNALPRVTR